MEEGEKHHKRKSQTAEGFLILNFYQIPKSYKASHTQQISLVITRNPLIITFEIMLANFDDLLNETDVQ